MDNNETVLFKNWSLETFSHKWNGVPYTFQPGEEKWMEGWMARHFAKHLTNREMNRAELTTDDQRRPEFEAKCFVARDTLPAKEAGDPAARKFAVLNKQAEADKEEKEEPKEAPEEAPEAPKASKPKARFCEECDSKGGRHKKDCPTKAFASLKKNETANA